MNDTEKQLDAIMRSRQDRFRNNPVKEKKIKRRLQYPRQRRFRGTRHHGEYRYPHQDRQAGH